MSLPPGPPNGVLGWAHMAEIRRDLVGFGARLQKEYGDVVFFRLGPLPCYQFTLPDHIHEVLVVKAGHFRKPARLRQVFGRFEGNGLVLSEGDFWTRQRRRVQPVFQPSRLESWLPEMARLTAGMLDRWRAVSEVDVSEEMHRLTMNIVARTLFSSEIDEFVEPLRQAVDEIQDWSMRELNRLVATPRWWPLLGQPKARKAMRFVRELVGRLISGRRRSGVLGDDLLGRLLTDAGTDPPRLDDEQLRDELVTFLLAGHETTAVSLIWSLWLLARNPEIQEAVAAEVNRAGIGRSPSFADLERFSAVERVFKEALRLYPPIYFFSREVETPVTVAGFLLRPPAQVFLFPWLTHRDERWFPHPDRFDPDRFIPERETRLPACAWFPFGAGPRACVGRHLATQEAIVVLKSVLHSFELGLPHSAEPSLQWQLSVHPAQAVRLQVRIRSAASIPSGGGEFRE